jgi:hypothetical protein
MDAKTSDVLDRFTILRMKKRFDNRVDPEYKEVEQEVFQNILQLPAGAKTNDIVLLMLDLMEANAKTWENEAAIRRELPNDPSNTATVPDTALSEIGRRTLIIRDHNKRRLVVKADVDKMFGQKSDVKVEHASE